MIKMIPLIFLFLVFCFNLIFISYIQAVRTSLMPGILKTVAHNKDHPKPIKVLFKFFLLVIDLFIMSLYCNHIL